MGKFFFLKTREFTRLYVQKKGCVCVVLFVSLFVYVGKYDIHRVPFKRTYYSFTSVLNLISVPQDEGVNYILLYIFQLNINACYD